MKMYFSTGKSACNAVYNSPSDTTSKLSPSCLTTCNIAIEEKALLAYATCALTFKFLNVLTNDLQFPRIKSTSYTYKGVPYFFAKSIVSTPPISKWPNEFISKG